jgi:catechol 2,3-dioxygenase-like lactoylglutathione lyase family enzyme
MLEQAKLVAFGAIVDVEPARAFYVELLGLKLLEDTPFALVLDANGTTLRLQKVGEHRPQPFTALGWVVSDVRATLGALTARGVRPKRYEFLQQDAAGIWTAPGGVEIAWFEDPAGNLLSISSC